VLEIVEAVQDSLFQSDAIFGVRVVGRHVEGGDLFIAGGVEGFYKGVVRGSEAVVGGDDEHRAGGEFGSEGGDVPCSRVCDDFFGEALGGASGEGSHAFVG